MNRDALRATAHNGCLRPTWGAYGAIRRPAQPRRRTAFRALGVAAAAVVIGGGIGAHFFLSGAPAPTPSIRILSPIPDVTLVGGKAFVAVEVRNAQLGVSTSSAKGYHLHYYLDAIVPTEGRRSANPSVGKYVSTTKTAHEWTVSGVGLHVLTVQLVTDDDRPLTPPVVAAVTVKVPKGASSAPSPSPSTPSPPAKTPGGC